jgi:hypothetical protein
MDRDRRLVLRLWPADVDIADEGIPIFLGTVEAQRRRQFAGLITAAKDTGAYKRALRSLKETLNGRFSVIQVSRARARAAGDGEHGQSLWRGDVLLVMSKNA